MSSSTIIRRPTGRLTGLLSAAVKHPDAKALRCLVERHKVDINSELVQAIVAYRRRKTRPLHMAIYSERRGLAERVDVLLGAGADPNCRDGRGNSALHVATVASEAAAARLLLGRGADPDKVDGRGETALHAAARQGHCQLVRALLDHAADQFIEDRAKMLPVHVAASAGNYHIVEMLCQADRRAVEARARHTDRRPIHLAAGAGHAETVALLADRLTADVACRDADGNTPLHCLITCNKCYKKYFGQTSRKLKERLNDHRRNIKLHKNTTIAIHSVPINDHIQVRENWKKSGNLNGQGK